MTTIHTAIARIRGAVDQHGIHLAQVESDLNAHLNTIDLSSGPSLASSRKGNPQQHNENREEAQGNNEE